MREIDWSFQNFLIKRVKERYKEYSTELEDIMREIAKRASKE